VLPTTHNAPFAREPPPRTRPNRTDPEPSRNSSQPSLQSQGCRTRNSRARRTRPSPPPSALPCFSSPTRKTESKTTTKTRKQGMKCRRSP
jgi:hypothetical protein